MEIVDKIRSIGFRVLDAVIGWPASLVRRRLLTPAASDCRVSLALLTTPFFSPRNIEAVGQARVHSEKAS